MRCTVFCIFVGFGLVKEIREVHPVRIRDVMGQFPGVQLSIGFARTVYRALRRI
jgi:hypothetical protein